jgi:hypothetical protein
LSKNRDRLLDGEVAQSPVRALMSDEHFSVKRTLIRAWAAFKSLQPKHGIDNGDGSPPPTGALNERSGRHEEQSWRGQRRNNDTHCSTIAPTSPLPRGHLI